MAPTGQVITSASVPKVPDDENCSELTMCVAPSRLFPEPRCSEAPFPVTRWRLVNHFQLSPANSRLFCLTVTSIETEGHSLQMLKLATCKEAAAIHQRQQFTITIRAVSVKMFRVYFSIHPQKNLKLCAGRENSE